MKSYLRILAFARPYKLNIGLNALFNFFMIFFSLASIGVLIPILGILFDKTERVYETIPEFKFSFKDLDFDPIKEYAYYHIGHWIENVGEITALAYICAIAAGLFLLKNLFRYLALFVIAPLRNGIVKDLRTAVFDKCLALPVSYFTEKRKGDIMSRLSSDVHEIQWTTLTSLEMIVREPLTIVLSMFVLVSISGKLTIFIFIVLPISGLIITTIGKSLKRSSTRAQSQLGYVMTVIEESLGGMRIIKAFTAEKKIGHKFDDAADQYRRTMNRVLRKTDAASPLSETLGVAAVLTVVWFGGKQVFAGELAAEALIAYIGFFYQLFPAFKGLTTAVYNIQKGNASAERIIEILDAPNPIVEKENPKKLTTFNDKIEFKNVDFAYTEDGEKVLKNINFSLNKGKTIALVGSSGSGKTTISNLAPRFYDTTSGQIIIDGVNIKDLEIKNLRGLMGMVSQESILFNDTVNGNISLSKSNATQEEIIEACKVANAHGFISEMEGGYEANIGEGGSKLSGGQKQRLSIARAVLNDPPILILDEATSALDTESERLVQEALNHLMKNRTSLIIAHRLSTIKHADEILVMEAGEVVERGTHDELLAKKGTYHKLVQLQSFA